MTKIARCIDDRLTDGAAELNSKNKNIRSLYREINGFRRGYQPRSNLHKNENGDLLADSNNTVNRRQSLFFLGY
jgi:hypothetical protein